jgi:hypothetical protein
MKTYIQDLEETKDFINGMRESFIEGITTDHSVGKEQLSNRSLAVLFENEEGEYGFGGGALTGTPLDMLIIPGILSKINEDGNRIVCIMEMTFNDETNKCKFYFRGELGENEEHYEEEFILQVNEGSMYINEDGDLVKNVEVIEV